MKNHDDNNGQLVADGRDRGPRGAVFQDRQPEEHPFWGYFRAAIYWVAATTYNGTYSVALFLGGLSGAAAGDCRHSGRGRSLYIYGAAGLLLVTFLAWVSGQLPGGNTSPRDNYYPINPAPPRNTFYPTDPGTHMKPSTNDWVNSSRRILEEWREYVRYEKQDRARRSSTNSMSQLSAHSLVEFASPNSLWDMVGIDAGGFPPSRCSKNPGCFCASGGGSTRTAIGTAVMKETARLYKYGFGSMKEGTLSTSRDSYNRLVTLLHEAGSVLKGCVCE